MAEFGKWIPVRWRSMTAEERECYPEDIVCVSDSELPDDGDEILISKFGWVDMVVFCNDADYGIGDEDGNDWLTDVDAWMPAPKPFKKEDA